jgi:hypothetical protein
MSLERGRNIQINRTSVAEIEVWESQLEDGNPEDDASWYEAALELVNEYDFEIVDDDVYTIDKWEDETD